MNECNTVAISEQWYRELCEDCRDIVVETEFAARWALVEGYHFLGKRIIEESDNLNKLSNRGVDVIDRMANDIQRSKRTIYHAIQFAKTYPDLNLLPEGKDCSWHKIVNKYLTNGKEGYIIKKKELYRMIREIKELLNTEYLKAHQEEVKLSKASYQYDSNQAVIRFIRYLQDQINKITGEVE
jgi:hypothetical protein